MEIKVKYKDQTRKRHDRIEYISILALIKHLALAGQGYLPSIKKYTKTVGIFAYFMEYLNINSISQSRFSEPPLIRRDPTEKGQFSTIVGKGIADLFAKRISNAKITHNYEAAMSLAGHKIKGARPDLYCLGDNFQFAVEAKGYQRNHISNIEMYRHKDQSKAGPLPVHFTIASVSYNLYDNVHCNYYDPPNENVEFNEELNGRLNKKYYKGLFEYLNSDYFKIEDGEIEGRHCYFIRIFGNGSPYSNICDKNIVDLILQSDFKEHVQRDKLLFNEAPLEGAHYYLDTDGIGIRMKWFGNPEKILMTESGYRNVVID